jgi:hypothetical protein
VAFQHSIDGAARGLEGWIVQPAFGKDGGETRREQQRVAIT